MTETDPGPAPRGSSEPARLWISGASGPDDRDSVGWVGTTLVMSGYSRRLHYQCTWRGFHLVRSSNDAKASRAPDRYGIARVTLGRLDSWGCAPA